MQMALQSILLIDDDDSIRRIAELTLSSLGHFQVWAARSGKEGLEKLNEVTPDLIILDVMMPVMDGPTVLSHIKANPLTASIPVVFMTAKIQKHEMATYSGLGISGIITKPFEVDEICDTLRKIYDDAKASRTTCGVTT